MEAIEPNSFIKELGAWLGVSVSYALARLYTGEEDIVSYDKVYAIAESDIYFVWWKQTLKQMMVNNIRINVHKLSRIKIRVSSQVKFWNTWAHLTNVIGN